jgi:hypothetical protein
LSPAHRTGARIVLEAFRAAPGKRLTNIELGNLPGVQAFRSRISDLRAKGYNITEGKRLRQGVYEYRLIEGGRTALEGAAPSDPEPICSHPYVPDQGNHEGEHTMCDRCKVELVWMAEQGYWLEVTDPWVAAGGDHPEQADLDETLDKSDEAGGEFPPRRKGWARG